MKTCSLTIYSRSYCHLCDDMVAALRSLQTPYELVIDVVDVDADSDLLAMYDELVPVLVGIRPNGEQVKLCHYYLDEVVVRSFVLLE
ncbi:MAG: glutaredoxin family protein [Pseudomonadota bacterium]